MQDWISLPSWLDLVDVALVASFGWLAIRYLRHTRARPALAGVALLGAVYFVARTLGLELTTALLQAFFAVLVLVLVVVFQEDLRRLFEQLGTSWRGRSAQPDEVEPVDLLVRIVARLAATRTGAIFVLPGREPLDRHLEGGIPLRGLASEPLLLSIFDASSPGHDGAVLLRGSLVDRFAVHLPLSANQAALGPGSTRHAAALGLAERCDATCVVVSEERGTVSVARNGELRTLDRPEDLARELRPAIGARPEERAWWQGRAVRDAVLATVAALVLWLVFVPGSDLAEITIDVPVEITNLPGDLVLENTEPPAVAIRLRGLRRDLLLVERESVRILIDAYLARLGRRTFQVTQQNVEHPDVLDVTGIDPDRIRIHVLPVSEAPTPAEGS